MFKASSMENIVHSSIPRSVDHNALYIEITGHAGVPLTLILLEPKVINLCH